MRLFSHDAAGNQLNDGLRSYTWRNSGQLARVAYSGVVTDYTYNGFSQRLRKTCAGVTTYYSYDEAGHLQGEYAADGSLLAEHLWLGDTPIATVQRQTDGSLATYYVFADHIDTPRALSDANGKILWRWDGEGFGRSPPDADADGDGVALTYNLRFPGQVFDKESNLHYNWNRYYDPVTERYVSSDPIGLAGGSFTTYGYVGGNPVSQFDPDGLEAVPLPRVSVPWSLGASAGLGGPLSWAWWLMYGVNQNNGPISSPCPPGATSCCASASSSGNSAPPASSGSGSASASSCKKRPNCRKASPWDLSEAGIDNEHEYKTENAAKPWSRFDICKCDDGTVRIAAVGQCGKTTNFWN